MTKSPTSNTLTSGGKGVSKMRLSSLPKADDATCLYSIPSTSPSPESSDQQNLLAESIRKRGWGGGEGTGTRSSRHCHFPTLPGVERQHLPLFCSPEWDSRELARGSPGWGTVGGSQPVPLGAAEERRRGHLGESGLLPRAGLLSDLPLLAGMSCHLRPMTQRTLPTRPLAWLSNRQWWGCGVEGGKEASLLPALIP